MEKYKGERQAALESLEKEISSIGVALTPVEEVVFAGEESCEGDEEAEFPQGDSWQISKLLCPSCKGMVGYKDVVFTGGYGGDGGNLCLETVKTRSKCPHCGQLLQL